MPKDLREKLQRTEIRFSLETEQRHEAIIAAIPLIADLPNLFADLRNMPIDTEAPPFDHFQSWLDEKRRTIRLQDENDELRERLLEAERLLAKSVPKDKARYIAKQTHTLGKLRGKEELERNILWPWPAERTVSFSELKEKYLTSLRHRPENGRKKLPTPKTLEEYDKALSFFITVMGDLRIGAIDREIAERYYFTLRKLPANINKIARFKGKTVDQLLLMNEPPQTERTSSKKIERVSFMFRWALEEKRKWGIEDNPFKGLGVADKEESTRRPFTHDELRALLNHPSFVKRQFFSSYSYWTIPLVLYTGAREGEIAQLDLKDFVEVDGYQCIDINDKDARIVIEEGGRKKRVKNKNAKRLVPIHPDLIRLGILRHVVALRQQGEIHLFPELNRERRDGPAHAVSNWFQRFRAKVELTAKQETVLHSFRHLFITTLLDSGIAPHLVAPIVGHEGKLITDQVYWGKKDVSSRAPTVESFNLPDDIKGTSKNLCP